MAITTRSGKVLSLKQQPRPFYLGGEDLGKDDDGRMKEGNISLSNPKSECFGKDGGESIETGGKEPPKIFSKNYPFSSKAEKKVMIKNFKNSSPYSILLLLTFYWVKHLLKCWHMQNLLRCW